MICERCVELLDDYIDGELPAEARAAVEAHLEGCVRCAAEHHSIASLVSLARALPRELPSEDRWPQIAAELAPRTSAREPANRWPWLALAVAAVALVTIGAALGSWRVSPTDMDGPAVATVNATAVPEVVVDLRALTAELEAVAGERALDDEVAAGVLANLELIDAAITEIEAALLEHPADPQLTLTLTRAYQHKIGVLSLVARSG